MANVPRIIVGSDPSYSAYGISIIDTISKEIITNVIETTLGKQEFYNICVKSKEQVDKVIEFLRKQSFPNIEFSLDVVFGMENALPFAFNATSLTALDVLLFHRFGEVRTALFNPTYLTYLMGKHTKRDSVNLANNLLSIFEKHDYKHSKQFSKKLTDGEAESFIYACRMFCRTFPNNEITKDILQLQPLFADVKEKFGKEFIY